MQNKKSDRALCRYHSIDNLANNMEEYNPFLIKIDQFMQTSKSLASNGFKHFSSISRGINDVNIDNYWIKFVYEIYDIEEKSSRFFYYDLWIEHFAIDNGPLS